MHGAGQSLAAVGVGSWFRDKPILRSLAGTSRATLAIPARVMARGTSSTSRGLGSVSQPRQQDYVPGCGIRLWRTLDRLSSAGAADCWVRDSGPSREGGVRSSTNKWGRRAGQP